MALGLGFLVVLGLVVDVLVDGVVEVFGLHQLPPDQLVSRDRLNVELDVVFGEPRAQRFEIVGEIVEDAQVRSQRIHRHARVGRERAEVLHHLRLHRNLVFGQRVERVDDDGRDVARRAGRIFGTVGEKAGRDRLALRFDGIRTERRAFESEERDRLRLSVLHDGDFVLLEIGNRLASLIGRDYRELDQRGSGTENRALDCAGLREGELRRERAALRHQKLRQRQFFS